MKHFSGSIRALRTGRCAMRNYTGEEEEAEGFRCIGHPPRSPPRPRGGRGERPRGAAPLGERKSEAKIGNRVPSRRDKNRTVKRG